jgi:hypothetical protein
VQGDQGPTGTQGDQGPTGAQGIAGATSLQAYAYIYNQSAQMVAVDGDVMFDSQVVLFGFTRPTASQVQVVNSGLYLITFLVSSADPNQFAILVNNSTIAPGSVYGSGTVDISNVGQSYVFLNTNDTLTLHNTTGAAVTLPNPTGGTQTAVNASITIESVMLLS